MKTLPFRCSCPTFLFASALLVGACQTAEGGSDAPPGNTTADPSTGDGTDESAQASGVDVDTATGGPSTAAPTSDTDCGQSGTTTAGWTSHAACADGALPRLTRLFATPGGKLLACTSGFEMWRSSELGKPFEKTHTDCREPVGQLPSGVLLFASGNGGLSYSDNDGESFREPTASELPFVQALTVHGDAAYALEAFQVLLTRDGMTFEPWAQIAIEDSSHVLVDLQGRVHVFGSQVVQHRGTSNQFGWGEVGLEGATHAAVASPSSLLEHPATYTC